MTIMRSQEEIEEAILALQQNKKECPVVNYFGEPIPPRIDIMIDVLRHNRSEEYIYINYQSQFPDGREDTIGHGNWRSAMCALEFLKGKWKLSDLLYPVN